MQVWRMARARETIGALKLESREAWTAAKFQRIAVLS
jgi:hypothetical protein